MAGSHRDFEKRITKLQVKHHAMTQGYSATVGQDGLVVLRPKRPRRRITARVIALLLLVGFVFKGFLLAYLGPETYAERVLRLQEGTVIEQAGAYVMQPDPGSEWIAAQLGPILR